MPVRFAIVLNVTVALLLELRATRRSRASVAHLAAWTSRLIT